MRRQCWVSKASQSVQSMSRNSYKLHWGASAGRRAPLLLLLLVVVLLLLAARCSWHDPALLHKEVVQPAGRAGGVGWPVERSGSGKQAHAQTTSRRPTANGKAHPLQSAATHCGSTRRSISLDQRAHRCMRSGRAGKLLGTCTEAHATPRPRVRTAACARGLLGRAAAGSLGAAGGPAPPAASGQLP